MKKIKKILIIVTIIMYFVPFTTVNAQPGNPPGGSENNGNPIGGGAPIGGGSLILIGLAAAYGGKKIYNLKKENLEE